MGQIIVSEFLSLDGVMESPDRWQTGYVNEQMSRDIEREISSADVLLFGRTTFLTMAEAWPSRTGPIADRFNNLPKVVVSTTLEETRWNRSRLTSENVVDEIRKLKQETSRSILVWGSWGLVQTLMKQTLIDAYHLYVHPCLLGSGKRLFGNDFPAQNLELLSSEAFTTGVIVQSYQKGGTRCGS